MGLGPALVSKFDPKHSTSTLLIRSQGAVFHSCFTLPGREGDLRERVREANLEKNGSERTPEAQLQVGLRENIASWGLGAVVLDSGFIH